MASADITIATAFATIQSDATQRTVTLPTAARINGAGAVANARHFILRNVGANAARIGIAGATLSAAGSAVNKDGECDLPSGGSVVLDRELGAFTHVSASGTALALSSGAG